MPALFILIIALIALFPVLVALAAAPKPKPPTAMQLTINVKRRPRKK